MRCRIWFELTQVKHHHLYCTFLIARRRIILHSSNITILAFSTFGAFGWKSDSLPLVACIVVALISLFKQLIPHIVPSEKDIEKLDQVVDFYFDQYNALECLWLDYENNRISEVEAQRTFYRLKKGEKKINNLVNQIVKRTSNSIRKRCDEETTNYLNETLLNVY